VKSELLKARAKTTLSRIMDSRAAAKISDQCNAGCAAIPHPAWGYLWTRKPRFQTATMLRVARMFLVGSPCTSSKSARLSG